MRTHVVANSQNRKTGPMAAVYRTQESCPTTCSLLGNGCYAEHGHGGRGPFSVATNYGADHLDKLRDLARTLPQGGWLRLNVSGDFLAEDGTPDTAYIEACNELVRKRPDLRVLAYTHAWRTLYPGMFSFTVNASCETPEEIVQAQDAGWQTVTVDTAEEELIGTTVAGRRVTRCPAETREATTCASCGACAADTRTRPTIAFVAHGARRKTVTRVITERRLQEV